MIPSMLPFSPMTPMQNMLSPMMAQQFMGMGGQASISLTKYVLYVGNIGTSMTEQQLKGIFSQHGNPLSVLVKKDHETQISKGFAFVTYGSQAEADAARAALNHSIIDGHELSVCFKRSPTE